MGVTEDLLKKLSVEELDWVSDHLAGGLIVAWGPVLVVLAPRVMDGYVCHKLTQMLKRREREASDRQGV